MLSLNPQTKLYRSLVNYFSNLRNDVYALSHIMITLLIHRPRSCSTVPLWINSHWCRPWLGSLVWQQRWWNMPCVLSSCWRCCVWRRRLVVSLHMKGSRFLSSHRLCQCLPGTTLCYMTCDSSEQQPRDPGRRVEGHERLGPLTASGWSAVVECRSDEMWFNSQNGVGVVPAAGSSLGSRWLVYFL